MTPEAGAPRSCLYDWTKVKINNALLSDLAQDFSFRGNRLVGPEDEIASWHRVNNPIARESLIVNQRCKD